LYLVSYFQEYKFNVLNIFLYADPDVEGDGPFERGENKKIGLKRLPLPLHGKLPVFNPKVKTRLEHAIIAYNFAREHNNALRNHVSVRSHWIKNKGDIRSQCPKKGIFNKTTQHCSDSHAKVSSILPSVYKICTTNQIFFPRFNFIKILGCAAMQCTTYKIWLV
jgi:hypothetical protein